MTNQAAPSTGNAVWNFAEVLPYFRRIESFEGGADENRGDKVPVRVMRDPMLNPLYAAFIEAGVVAGSCRSKQWEARIYER